MRWEDKVMRLAPRTCIMLVVAQLLLLSACANPLTPVESDDMIGPGRATDDYKLSPCSCIEMQLAPLDRRSIETMHEIYG
ncbi:hypothetical protein TH30_19390 [Thalassospira profundimaris]|uniref:Uncharacterized protein n=2 Tax=Thalassospira profundimaris TaxID=502049 RepID=A0A367WP83_9PROT|nr:hypothetical protein TH30_19390 [Thalassospira profundimaris]